MAFASSGGSPSSTSTWLKQQLSSKDSPEEQWPDLLMDRKPITERKVWKNIDPVVIERTNLVAISQLVIKNLLDSSLRHARQLDVERSLPLQQLFVLLDLVFRHGFRTGRRLISGGKDIWSLLQQIDRLDHSAVDISESVRELPHVKTNMGRARAWFRLALMQKKLPEYFKALLEHKETLLREYYHPEALLLSEEAVLFSGLLVSLNIVDFNLCVKDEELDFQNNVIDLTMYLRRKEDIGRTDSQEEEEQVEATDLQTVIDQKNYIEEVNRIHASNITNLQAKSARLATTNQLMQEDLAITKRKLEEAQKLKELLQEQVDIATQEAERMERFKQERAEQEAAVVAMESNLEPPAVVQQEQEQQALKQLERELQLEVQMKSECEVAMKLLEKDVHSKQDTIVSLRAQLEDIKAINLEMYTKLAECKKTIEVKTDMINQLEGKSGCLLDTMQQLDDKYVESERANLASRAKLDSLEAKLKEKTEAVDELEQDIKIEREWRERLQEVNAADRECMDEMKQELDFLKQVANDYENIRQENLRLKSAQRENDQTLEELGQQLSWNKLQLDTLKEESKPIGVGWEKDADAAACKICEKEFNIARRKHHCRNCGGIFCDKCSDNKMELPSSAKKLRVCDNCYLLLLDRQSKI